MELISSPLMSKWRRYWRRNRYERLDGGFKGRKSNMKVIRIGDSPPRRVWKLRAAKKLKILKIACSSPLKLLRKLKDAYIGMMVNLASNVGYLNAGGGGDVSVFGNKRIPKGRQTSAAAYTQEDFDARMVYEIYKALKATQ